VKRSARTRPSRALAARREAVIWHDVECGGYDADLPLWRELARGAGGPILDLGAGTGRVTLDLAAAGHDVTALDADAVLLDELAGRAHERGLHVRCITADARALDSVGLFSLVLAPMQFVQIMGGERGRAALLRGVAACLHPGGTFAAAISDLDEAIPAEDAAPPLPDVGERGGWIYSSLPLDVRPEPGGIAVEWLRQVVSPAGELNEQRRTQMLDSLTPAQLAGEAAAHRLRLEARHEIGHTTEYIGSTVVLLERPEADRLHRNAGLDAPRR
jgi:SAM-dependent methyltransferase